MPASSYTTKNLRFTFTLTNSNAVFPGTTANQLQISGLRASCVVKTNGFPSYPSASIHVNGLSQQDMNALAIVRTQVGKPQYTLNTVLVEADSGQGFGAVFFGQIMQAGPDYTNSPDVSLAVQAQALGLNQLLASVPISFPGVASVADIASAIAATMGAGFENDGVTSTLTNAYYASTPATNLKQLIADTGIYGAVENNVLIISPAGVPRTNVEAFVLTPTSGLISYPEVLGNGYLNVRSLYNPAFRQNGPITIQGSDVVIDLQQTTINSLADGNWTIGPMTHSLESLKPGGAWFSDMLLYPPNSPPPVNS